MNCSWKQKNPKVGDIDFVNGCVVNNFTQSAQTVVEAKKPLEMGKYFSVIRF